MTRNRAQLRDFARRESHRDQAEYDRQLESGASWPSRISRRTVAP